MRKNINILIICFLFPLFPRAQSINKSESLKSKLNAASTDTARAQALADLCFYYQELNRDSAMYYDEQLINLGEKMKNPLVKVSGIAHKTYTLYHKNDYLASFKMLNEGLEILRDKETGKVKWGPATFGTNYSPAELRVFLESFLTVQTAFIHGASGNPNKAIEYYKRAIDIATPLNIKTALLGIYMNLGSIYIDKNELDSALLYSRKAIQYSVELNETFFRGIMMIDIGDIYNQKDQLDSARYYYFKGLPLNQKAEFRIGEIENLLGLANYYQKIQQVDSMLFYGKEAFRLSEEFRRTSSKVRASELIALASKIKGNTDSAYSYMEISKITGDSLSKEKEKKRTGLQSYNFEEQLRIEKAAQENIAYRNRISSTAMIAGLGLVSLLAIVFYRNNRRKQKANKVLETTLTELKSTQQQLIQSEKMASLGELTAGIAHEIQNPLNFVNNFSDVSNELVDEMNTEIDKGNLEEAKAIAADIKSNLEKINHHGKRADTIVKGMLQHSRKSEGQKEPTDINSLCDEYLRLSYHGLRAKDKSFNATLKTDFDETIGKINIIPQDMGRVIMNLLTNAFYAVNEKQKLTTDHGRLTTETVYQPMVSISTKKSNTGVEIIVTDNGNGIPQNIIDKIFQPFFTTKPTGSGTGLGLSLSYDIIKAHNGELKVESTEGEFTRFIITLPV